MERVIITGANGFVGSYTVKKFIDEGKEVLAIDRAEIPERLFKHPKLKYIQCDISDCGNLINELPCNRYDTFIHFAWAGSAGSDRNDYNLQLKNAISTLECIKVAKNLGCSRFVCAGSIMEYEVEAVIHKQESRPGLGYIYGMGKHVAHCMSKAVAADIGIELVWAMITNAYGVGEVSPRFVNTTLRKIIDGEPLKFTAATQNYDFVYVTDVANAFYLISQKGKAFCEYIIGSGEAKPLRDFICEMTNELAPKLELCFGDIPYTGVNMPLDVFDISDLKRDTGYEPKVSFVQGTKITMEWLQNL